MKRKSYVKKNGMRFLFASLIAVIFYALTFSACSDPFVVQDNTSQHSDRNLRSSEPLVLGRHSIEDGTSIDDIRRRLKNGEQIYQNIRVQSDTEGTMTYQVPMTDSDVRYLLEPPNDVEPTRSSSAFEYTRIRTSTLPNGTRRPNADSIVIVLLGDGFTAAQYAPQTTQGTVLWHADRAISALETTHPFSLFAHLFTVYVIHVDTPVNQAGFLNTVTAPITDGGVTGRNYRGNIFTAIEANHVRTHAASPSDLNANDITMIQILCNALANTGQSQMTWDYGLRTPINVARTSLRTSTQGGENGVWHRDTTVPLQYSGTAWHGTIIHEFGHSFGQLVDEHDDRDKDGKIIATRDELRANSTKAADANVKWRHWFGHRNVLSTPTRFSDGWAVPAAVSDFSGLSGCLMRASWGNRNFCGVCRAELTRRMALISGEIFHGRSPVTTDSSPNTPTVTIPQGVARILDSAFHGNTSLQTITIPASVTAIGDYAFLGATGLRSITNNATIPQQVNYTTFATSGVTGGIPNQLNRALITVDVPAGTLTAYRDAGWTDFNLVEAVFQFEQIGTTNNAKISLSQAGRNKTGKIEIPATIFLNGSVRNVTEIAASGFANARFNEVIIPNSVTTIGYGAFSNNSSFERVWIPSSVTVIDSMAFSNCSLLTIYAQAENKPSGWNASWNSGNDPVWGSPEAYLKPITNSIIYEVPVPDPGTVPMTTFSSSQYSGNVTWGHNHNVFQANFHYTAVITLTANTGYSLKGLHENYFYVNGSTSTTSTVVSGTTIVVTANFKAKTVINTVIQGVRVPSTGIVSVTTINELQYTGNIVWSPNDPVFYEGVRYTANIYLYPKADYTAYSISANSVLVPGARETYNHSYNGSFLYVQAVFQPTRSIVGSFDIIFDEYPSRKTPTRSRGVIGKFVLYGDDSWEIERYEVPSYLVTFDPAQDKFADFLEWNVPSEITNYMARNGKIADVPLTVEFLAYDSTYTYSSSALFYGAFSMDMRVSYSGARIISENDYLVVLDNEQISYRPYPISVVPVSGSLIPVSSFYDGDGTKNFPYLIENITHLGKIQMYDSSTTYFKLIDNIDLTNAWTFSVQLPLPHFYGHFDGNGKTISNLSGYSPLTSGGGFGLFEENSGTIENLNVTGWIGETEETRTGLIAGINHGLIKKCTSRPSSRYNMIYGTQGFNSYAGGITGYNAGTIQECINYGGVQGKNHVGGIAGSNFNSGIIVQSINFGSVQGRSNTGGIVGNNNGLVALCYNTGEVYGNNENFGGIVGISVYGSVENTYNTGNVSGGENVGGIVGRNEYSSVDYSYNTGNVSGGNYVGGIVGGYSYSVYNCVSLGKEISGAANVIRVSVSGYLYNNKARTDMILTANSPVTITSHPNGIHGESIPLNTPLSAVFSGWDTGVWHNLGGNLTVNGALPILRDMLFVEIPKLP